MDDKQLEPWQTSLETYIRQGEPGQAEKSQVWQTAIGLQAVDGLQTSDYLLETAKAHIDGDIDIGTVKHRLDSYYEAQTIRHEKEADIEEADKVSARIVEILGEQTFQFSPAELTAIHGRLFADIYPHAGRLRDYNITKKEWVLGGDTVLYAAADSLRATLDYDFAQERAFSYAGLSLPDAIRHFAQFISGIWQIHPFGEGNTRTTAVFAIKYLRSLGFHVQNEPFVRHSWYFRNALVRANYTNLAIGVHAETVYLERFFENLLLGTEHPLKNRFLHIGYQSDSGTMDDPKCQNDTLDCTLEELALLRAVQTRPDMTQTELARQIGKSPRTVKRMTVRLQEKGFLAREGGKRSGRWVVQTELT